MIAGKMQPDSGIVVFSKDARLGYLRQNNDFDSDLTIREELTNVIRPILDMTGISSTAPQPGFSI